MDAAPLTSRYPAARAEGPFGPGDASSGYAEPAAAAARRGDGGDRNYFHADVILEAQAGSDNILTLGDVWRRFPIGQVIRTKWSRAPCLQVVARSVGSEAQVKRLYDWREPIDSWITEHRLPVVFPSRRWRRRPKTRPQSRPGELPTGGPRTPLRRSRPESRRTRSSWRPRSPLNDRHEKCCLVADHHRSTGPVAS